MSVEAPAASATGPAPTGGPPPVATHHRDQRRVVTHIERPPTELIETYSGFYSALVLDHLGKLGGMDQRIKPVWEGAFVCGPAITCLGPDWRMRGMAADLAQPGDVIVVAAGGISERACFGDMTATRFQAKGIAGVVIDGATRDVRGIRELRFPTFARSITPRSNHYPQDLDHGAVNIPVVCGDVLVRPGDIVIGDDDGVVVVPIQMAAEVATAAAAYLEHENAKRAKLQEAYLPFGVADELKERGYEFA
jgi:4-hydroxy-4-methyl-2-oxoglutarate aldolase